MQGRKIITLNKLDQIVLFPLLNAPPAFTTIFVSTNINVKYHFARAKFQGFVEPFTPGGSKAKLHAHNTLLINNYISTNNILPQNFTH